MRGAPSSRAQPEDRRYDAPQGAQGDSPLPERRALREAGEHRVEAREIGDDLRWQVFTILESCTEKTRKVEALIWRVDSDTAQIYLGGPEHR